MNGNWGGWKYEWVNWKKLKKMRIDWWRILGKIEDKECIRKEDENIIVEGKFEKK